MNLVVVVLLGGLWVALLLPGVVRARRDASPINSVDSFERSMITLAGNVDASARPQSTTGRAARRRREVLARLATAVAVTATVALLVGGLAWLLFALAVLALAAYVGLLFQVQAREEEVRRKVRRLPQRSPQVETVRIRRWGA